MKKFFPCAQKNDKPRGEGVDGDAGLDPGPQVFEAVRQRVGQLQVGGRAGLLHVVARDGDRVELGHVRRGVLEDVRDDLHRGGRRIDVGVPHHVLLQDVVLDRPRELLRLHALLQGRDDVEGEHREHRAVHRHGNTDTIQRDAGEERLHVQDGIHGDARLAHVAHHPGVVAVVAPVGRPGRRPPTGRSAPRPGSAGKRRCFPWPWRTRRTGGSSTASGRTSWRRGP